MFLKGFACVFVCVHIHACLRMFTNVCNGDGLTGPCETPGRVRNWGGFLLADYHQAIITRAQLLANNNNLKKVKKKYFPSFFRSWSHK